MSTKLQIISAEGIGVELDEEDLKRKKIGAVVTEIIANTDKSAKTEYNPDNTSSTSRFIVACIDSLTREYLMYAVMNSGQEVSTLNYPDNPFLERCGFILTLVDPILYIHINDAEYAGAETPTYQPSKPTIENARELISKQFDALENYQSYLERTLTIILSRYPDGNTGSQAFREMVAAEVKLAHGDNALMKQCIEDVLAQQYQLNLGSAYACARTASLIADSYIRCRQNSYDNFKN